MCCVCLNINGNTHFFNGNLTELCFVKMKNLFSKFSQEQGLIQIKDFQTMFVMSIFESHLKC